MVYVVLEGGERPEHVHIKKIEEVKVQHTSRACVHQEDRGGGGGQSSWRVECLNLQHGIVWRWNFAKMHEVVGKFI